MRLRSDHRKASLIGSELVEIVTPRTNTASITPAENLFAAGAHTEPFGLEIAATGASCRFLARASNAVTRGHLESRLAAAYPQAGLRRLEITRDPGLDPARLGPDEQVAACALVLRAPPYLPLRTFHDAELDAERNAQADPVLGILGALGDLPPGWRGLAQLVLRPAPDDWCRGYLRLAIEHPLADERTAGPSLTSVLLLAGLLVAGTLAVQGLQWYRAGDWLHLALLIGSLVTGGPGLIWLGRRLTTRPIYDMRLVQEKVSRIAYLTQIRLAVFAPASVPAAEVETRLQRLASTYRQFNLASGNGLRPRRLTLRGRDLRWLGPLLPLRAMPVLNTRELAGLWHLPQAQADVTLLERTGACQRLPLPDMVGRGCRIGVSSHQGRTVPVALPDELLRRHLLLVAKTRRGKSSLLLRIAQDRMWARLSGGQHPTLILVDPHYDLAQAALGLVPPERREDVVFLDVAERNRPFGLNLLDTGLFADRDKAVANALAIFRRQFDRFWGPRMEDAFRFALLTLYEVNQTLRALDPAARDRQHTILDVPALLVNPTYRRGLLDLVSDSVVTAWWSGYFDPLDRRLQLEIANPVQTKAQRFAGSRAARTIVGQPGSTINPANWLQSGEIVIVNTAKGTVGEDTSALIGATLLNLVALAIGERARLDPRQRQPVTLIVDEFHTMPGADYEAILAELAKYGANLVLATQTLAALDIHDGEQQRALRATVFANLDGLFAFHTSAEDARYLVPELGGEVDVHDLVALGEHQCYVKLSARGERLPTFSVRLDPPPTTDPAVAAQLAAISAARYGRDAAAVARDLQSALSGIEAHQQNAVDGGGVSADPNIEVKTSVQTSTQKQGKRTDNRQTKSPAKKSEQSVPLPTQSTPATRSKDSPRQLALAEGEPDRKEESEP